MKKIRNQHNSTRFVQNAKNIYEELTNENYLLKKQLQFNLQFLQMYVTKHIRNLNLQYEKQQQKEFYDLVQKKVKQAKQKNEQQNKSLMQIQKKLNKIELSWMNMEQKQKKLAFIKSQRIFTTEYCLNQ